MRTLCVIPARYASTRLPGKPLADICGKPMICRVLARAQGAKKPEKVLVATDDRRIYDAGQKDGGSNCAVGNINMCTHGKKYIT